MTRMLTVMTLATLFCSTAMAEAGPDVGAPVTTCDSSQFRNQGQWVKCLLDDGLRGKELAHAIHDEHEARKGGEPSRRSAQRAKHMARRAQARYEGGGRKGPAE